MMKMLDTRPFQPLQTCPGQPDQPCLIQISVSDSKLVRVEIMHLPVTDLIRLQGILTVVHITYQNEHHTIMNYSFDWYHRMEVYVDIVFWEQRAQPPSSMRRGPRGPQAHLPYSVWPLCTSRIYDENHKKYNLPWIL